MHLKHMVKIKSALIPILNFHKTSITELQYREKQTEEDNSKQVKGFVS